MSGQDVRLQTVIYSILLSESYFLKSVQLVAAFKMSGLLTFTGFLTTNKSDCAVLTLLLMLLHIAQN